MDQFLGGKSVAIAMIAFIAVLAFVIDLAHMHTVRQELQNAAEAGALAGARALMPLKPPAPPGFPYCSLAQLRARETALLNKSDGDAPVTVIADADVQLIRWDWQTNTRNDTPSCDPIDTGSQVNGIRVTTRRDSTVPAGSVFLTFGNIFAEIMGKDTMDVVASATAAFGYVAGLFNNIAISQTYLNSIINETGDILLTPDKLDNGGWAAPYPSPVGASDLVNWVNGTPPSPGVQKGDSLSLDNGSKTTVLQALQTAVQDHSQTYDNVTGFVTGLLVLLPVVDTSTFSGSGPITIIRLQPVIITSVTATGSPKGINFRIYNGISSLPGTNPGGTQSPLYTLPKLVE